MTVVAILAIVLGIGIPSFQEFMVNNRTSVQTNALLSDLAIARSEAVKYARRTEVRAEAGGWADGWFVWTDLDSDNTVDDNEVVRRQGAAEEDFTIEAGDSDGAAVTLVAFGVTGTLVDPPDGVSAEFAVCRPDGDASKSRGIVVAPSGRAESQKAENNTSISCSSG